MEIPQKCISQSLSILEFNISFMSIAMEEEVKTRMIEITKEKRAREERSNKKVVKKR